jgi:hypothetical protein
MLGFDLALKNVAGFFAGHRELISMTWRDDLVLSKEKREALSASRFGDRG